MSDEDSPVREPDATIEAEQERRFLEKIQRECPHDGNWRAWRQRGADWAVCLKCGFAIERPPQVLAPPRRDR